MNIIFVKDKTGVYLDRENRFGRGFGDHLWYLGDGVEMVQHV